MADLCSMVGCNSLGAKSCGACGEVSYCSADCQKGDWKVHKRSCVNIKKIPTTFLSIIEINKYDRKIRARLSTLLSQQRIRDAITLLESYQPIMEHQFGVQVEGKPYCKRSNGDLVSNILLITILTSLTTYYIVVRDMDSVISHGMSARRMLEHHDKSDDTMLLYLAKAEGMISSAYRHLDQFDAAEHHCEHRLIKGEERLNREIGALRTFSSIRACQNRYPEAVEFAERAYILVSEAHGPEHSDVQDVAISLIDTLIESGDYSRADDYCRMNLDNLTDPRNGVEQESEDVALGMKQIAQIWLLKAPVDDEEAAFALAEEAEDMARKACAIVRIGTTATWTTTLSMDSCYDLLARVLRKREKHTDESRIEL